MKISFSSDKTTAADRQNHVKVPYAAAKRTFPKLRWMLILLVVLSPFLVFLGKLIFDWVFVTSPGSIWLEKQVVNVREAGTVEKILYRRGDSVPPEAVMFQVRRKLPENRAEQIALLEAQLKAERSGGPGIVPSRGTEAARELAQQKVDYHAARRSEMQWLVAKGAATKAELAAAEEALRGAQSALAALEAPVAASLDANAVRAVQAEESIKALKAMSGEALAIKAGRGGKVASVLVSEGQSFAPNEPLALVVDREQVHVITYVDPSDFKKIHVGKSAQVKVLGTGRKINAVVEQPPVLADSVPSGISEKFYPITMRGVQVFLKVLEPLREEELVEGLPVVVAW